MTSVSLWTQYRDLVTVQIIYRYICSTNRKPTIGVIPSFTPPHHRLFNVSVLKPLVKSPPQVRRKCLLLDAPIQQ